MPNLLDDLCAALGATYTLASDPEAAQRTVRLLLPSGDVLVGAARTVAAAAEQVRAKATALTASAAPMETPTDA